MIYLIHLLNRFSEDFFLKDRFVLKGGTALNLFCFDYPRLSVDIDINYIGSADREVMLREKGALIPAFVRACNSYYKYGTGRFWLPDSKKVYEGLQNKRKDFDKLNRKNGN